MPHSHLFSGDTAWFGVVVVVLMAAKLSSLLAFLVDMIVSRPLLSLTSCVCLIGQKLQFVFFKFFQHGVYSFLLKRSASRRCRNFIRPSVFVFLIHYLQEYGVCENIQLQDIVLL